MMVTHEGLNPDLSVEMEDNSIGGGGGVDVPNLTTTIQRHCALATDTPTPVVDVILWSTMTQPRGHLSCKQSKN
jgi:hypothetical protein